MKVLSSLLIFFLTLVFGSSSLASEFVAIEIHGTIDPATSRYLARSIDQATASMAQFVLVELDTPGGLVTSVREMAQTIDKASLPVIVYTTPAGASATSAGAILMISSHLSAMAPGTNIGAAHPVGAQGEDIKGTMGEKAVNDISAFARSMATLRGRNSKAAGEVVTKSTSFTSDEALKANVIEIIAKDRADLLKQIHGRKVSVGEKTITLQTQPVPTEKKLEMTIGEKFLHYVSHPNIAAILMTLGILFIYAELSAPGLGVPGILGATCLVVAFISFQALPIQTGGLLLLIFGVVLILAEFFVGTGALALGGSVALVLGLLWVIDPAASDLRISPVIVGVIGGVAFFITLFFAYSIWQGRNIKASPTGTISAFGLQFFSGRIDSVDDNGNTGFVKIRGELWKFVSKVPLKPGDSVAIVRTDGLVVEVVRS